MSGSRKSWPAVAPRSSGCETEGGMAEAVTRLKLRAEDGEDLKVGAAALQRQEPCQA